MFRVVLVALGSFGLVATAQVAIAQPTPGGPLRSSVPLTAASLEAPSPSATTQGAPEDSSPALTPLVEDADLSAEQLWAPGDSNSAPAALAPVALVPSDVSVEEEALVEAREHASVAEPSFQQLVEQFERKVAEQARRWEFTLRLIEERERRDVAAYVASFVLEQRKREFTRRLVEQRIAARGSAGPAVE
jgi:hypothetical protein